MTGLVERARRSSLGPRHAPRCSTASRATRPAIRTRRRRRSAPMREEVGADPGRLRVGVMKDAPGGQFEVHPECVAAVEEAARPPRRPRRSQDGPRTGRQERPSSPRCGACRDRRPPPRHKDAPASARRRGRRARRLRCSRGSEPNRELNEPGRVRSRGRSSRRRTPVPGSPSLGRASARRARRPTRGCGSSRRRRCRGRPAPFPQRPPPRILRSSRQASVRCPRGCWSAP